MSERSLQKRRQRQMVVHLPPRPGRAPVFFGAGLLLFGILYLPAVFVDALGGVLTAFWPVVGLGVLPALFCWYAFGSRIYEIAQEAGFVDDADIQPASPGHRFTLFSYKGHPHGVVIERPSESGTCPGDGHLLCCDPSEPRRFRHPVMVLQYAAWAALIWHAVKPLREPFYLLSGAFVAILVCFFWLIIDSPWYALDFTAKGCFLDINATPHGRQSYPLQIRRAVPEGTSIVLTLEDGVTREVAFPKGSLSPETQQVIALDLFRHHGIPTTEEADKPAAGLHR